jgi:molybdopterin-containing oxidoreductase family membrane subunit
MATAAADTASVLGVFAHVDTTLRAIRDLRARGFSELTVYTPVPVEEIEEEVERVRPLSKVRLFSVIGALIGTTTAFFLTIWTSLKWELVTGGKAPVSIPPFIIIVFELTILLCGLSTLLAMLVLGRLPKLRPSATYDPRFTVDRFGVAVACRPDQAEAVRAVLSSAGAEEVRR